MPNHLLILSGWFRSLLTLMSLHSKLLRFSKQKALYLVERTILLLESTLLSNLRFINRQFDDSRIRKVILEK